MIKIFKNKLIMIKVIKNKLIMIKVIKKLNNKLKNKLKNNLKITKKLIIIKIMKIIKIHIIWYNKKKKVKK